MEQRSEEWYAARLGICTASRLYDVIKKNSNGAYSAQRKNYMAELIAERLSGINAEKFQSKQMEWGNEWESLARSAYEANSGNLVIETGLVLHPTIKHFGASPDGLIMEHGVLEIKDPMTSTHMAVILSPIIDPQYVCQMHGQMACTGRQWADFVSFDPRMPESFQLYIDRVQRSESKIKEIETEVKKFLEELEETIDKLFERRPAGKEEYVERWRNV